MTTAALQAHYDAMRTAAVQQLAQGQAQLDPLLDDPADTRRGLTLLARLPATVAEALALVLANFRAQEPDQYYYPASDLHLTVLSLISCTPGFQLGDVDPAAYGQLVAEVLRGVPPLRLTLTGLTASAGAVLLQGFPVGNALAELRAALRGAFRQSGLRQSIDARYSLQTAHVTLLRFRTELRDAAGVARQLARYQHYPIGTVELPALELVYNDWYQRQASTVLLEKYRLSGS